MAGSRPGSPPTGGTVARACSPCPAGNTLPVAPARQSPTGRTGRPSAPVAFSRCACHDPVDVEVLAALELPDPVRGLIFEQPAATVRGRRALGRRTGTRKDEQDELRGLHVRRGCSGALPLVMWRCWRVIHRGDEPTCR